MAEAEPALEDQPSRSRKPSKSSKPHARIEVSGEAPPDLMDRVVNPGGSRGGRGRGSDGENRLKFETAIRDPNVKIICRRVLPQTLDDGTPLSDEYNIFPHPDLTKQEIVDELRESRGGKQWHVRVEDESGEILSADKLRVPGEPIIDPTFAELDPRSAGGGRGKGGRSVGPYEDQVELTAEEQLEQDPEIIKAKRAQRLVEIETESLKKNAALDAAKAEAEKAKRALDAAIRGETNGNGKRHGSRDDDDADDRILRAIEEANKPLKEQNAALQRRLDESERRNAEKESKADTQRMIEANTGPLKASIDAQQRQLDQILAAVKDGGQKQGQTSVDQLLAKMESLETRLKADQREQIHNAFGQVETKLMGEVKGLASSIQNLQTQVAAGANKGESTLASTAVKALTDIATKGGGANSAQDPMTTLERTMTLMNGLAETKSLLRGEGSDFVPPDFGSYVVSQVGKLAPDVFEFIDRQTSKSERLTKEMLETRLKQGADKMFEGLNQEIKNQFGAFYADLERRGLLKPGAPQFQTPQAPAQSPAQTPQASAGGAPPPVRFPGNAPSSPSATPPPAGPVSSSPVDQKMEEYKRRVNWLLKGMLEEIEIGASVMQWPRVAFENLPKDIVDKIVFSEDLDALAEILKPYADPALVEKLWGYLKDSHPQHDYYLDWIANGIDWMKEAAGVEIEKDDGQTA